MLGCPNTWAGITCKCAMGECGPAGTRGGGAQWGSGTLCQESLLEWDMASHRHNGTGMSEGFPVHLWEVEIPGASALRNSLYWDIGESPRGWTQGRGEKGFQHTGASKGGNGESMAQVSVVRGVPGVLTFQGSFCAGSLGSLSSRSPAGPSRAAPCCRAATCVTTGIN